MLRQTIALLALLVLPTSAQALELGIQDAIAPIEQRNEWATQTGAQWERIIAYVGEPEIADKIRESHAAGRHVILTIGGTTRETREPNFSAATRYIRSLPRAERYSIRNEPDFNGIDACEYRRGWMKARRTFGRRLLWGDFSAHYPVTFTAKAAQCGRLPKNLDFAVHPYQPDDPLAHTEYAPWAEGALGNLGVARSWMKRNLGIKVNWWLTEFGYGSTGKYFAMTDDRAAWLWPRALKQARRMSARVLVIYTAQGASWDTRPGELAWAAIRAANV